MAKFYSVTSNNPQHLDNSSSDYQRYGEEVVDSSSKLLGKIIGQVDVWLAKVNDSVSGTVYCRIRDSNDTIQCEIGHLDCSTIAQASEFPNNPTTFGPNNNNSYALQVGDKVLVEYTSGSSSSYIRVGEDNNAPYDSGTHSYAIYYQNGKYGRNTPSRDFAANFWDVVGGAPPPPPTPPPPGPAPPAPPPPPPPPAVGTYTYNLARDLAGNFWTIGSGVASPPPPVPSPIPPPPPPVPGGIPPPPPPPGVLFIFYLVPNLEEGPKFLSGTGQAGSSQAFIRIGEVANGSKSQLIGKIPKEVDFFLTKVGNPTGIVTMNIRKGIDDSVAATMGTLNAVSMSTNTTMYTFINRNNTYALKKGDKILVEYSGGDANNYIGIIDSDDDPYDGAQSCSIYYTVSKVYQTQTSNDICGIFSADIFLPFNFQLNF